MREAIAQKLQKLVSSTAGQTTSEYVAITAVAVGLAMSVSWVLLKSQLVGALTNLGTNLNSLIVGMF